MALIKWSPSRDIDTLRRDVERMFEEFWEGEPVLPRMWRRWPWFGRPTGEAGVILPSLDMYDNKDEIVVKAELPGVEKKDINISIRDDTLLIKGEMKKEEEVKEGDYYYSERSYGSFGREITLPTKVKQDEIKATFKNGVLEIHLPKVEEAKPKEVKVEVK